MKPFAIFEAPVAGGVLALSPLPGRSGRYEADFSQVLDWAPDLVVSMTESAEMAEGGAGGFDDDLRRAGVDWAHLPVVDFGGLRPDQGADWIALRDKALGLLRNKGRVLVHCRGGCGRSGMVALRLMVETGEEPGAALMRLRAVRSCAVETEAQMRWACDLTL